MTLPLLAALALSAPVAAGLLGALLPAFGYMPALGATHLSFQPFRDLFGVPGLWTSVTLSLVCGFGTTLVSVLLAMLFAASFSGTRLFQVARQMLGPLFAVPHAAAAFGLAFLIAPSGLLMRLAAGPLGLAEPPDLLLVGDRLGLAMMAGLIVKELPFLMLVIIAALPQTDRERRMRLCRSLGYGRVAGFIVGVWPAIYRQIRLPVLAVAAFASSVVDVGLILGPSRPAPLAVRLIGWMGDPDLSLRFQASAGAILQLGVTLAVLGLWLAAERLGSRLLRQLATGGRRFPRDRPVRLAAALALALAAGAAGLGLAALALWSVAGLWTFPDVLPGTITGRVWGQASASALRPLATAATVAVLSAAIALVLVVSMLEAQRGTAAHSRRPPLTKSVAVLLYLPLIVPQVSFVFGLQILVLAVGLAPSLPLVVVVHLVFVAPYVALALAAPWASLDPRYEQMSASLGRSRRAAFFRLRLPLLTAPLMTAFAIGFSVSVAQYLPTLLVGAGRITTITTEAVALSSGGNRRTIGVYALLQTLLPCLVLGLATLLPVLLHRNRGGMRV